MTPTDGAVPGQPGSSAGTALHLDEFRLEAFGLAAGLGGTSMVLVHTVCGDTVDDDRDMDGMVSGNWSLGDVVQTAQAHVCEAS